MTAQAEHALRTLADKLLEAADGMPEGVGQEVMLAMGVAHKATADQLEGERKEREARLCADETGVTYNPKGGKHGTRKGRGG